MEATAHMSLTQKYQINLSDDFWLYGFKRYFHS